MSIATLNPTMPAVMPQNSGEPHGGNAVRFMPIIPEN